MNIVNFTPITAFTGGLIIGLAVVIFFLLNGRLVGISGIASNALTSKDNKLDNILFLIGLIIGPIIYSFFSNQSVNITISNSYIVMIFAGLLVGVGTRISGGCTSGHGISGIGRFSLRSIIATVSFMVVGIITVLINNLNMNRIASLVSGIVFGLGLTISEMINPAKVLGFLDLFGNWDPSLMFVMIGALVVSSPMFHLIKKKEKPIFAEKFNYSNNKVIDNKLVIGSALFGAGWGLGGLCPGPAISSIALLNIYSVTFVISMFVGFYLVKTLKSI
jgi:uncharacterized membrane protein YedE/YeeE